MTVDLREKEEQPSAFFATSVPLELSSFTNTTNPAKQPCDRLQPKEAPLTHINQALSPSPLTLVQALVQHTPWSDALALAISPPRCPWFDQNGRSFIPHNIAPPQRPPSRRLPSFICFCLLSKQASVGIVLVPLSPLHPAPSCCSAVWES